MDMHESAALELRERIEGIEEEQNGYAEAVKALTELVGVLTDTVKDDHDQHVHTKARIEILIDSLDYVNALTPACKRGLEALTKAEVVARDAREMFPRTKPKDELIAEEEAARKRKRPNDFALFELFEEFITEHQLNTRTGVHPGVLAEMLQQTFLLYEKGIENRDKFPPPEPVEKEHAGTETLEEGQDGPPMAKSDGGGTARGRNGWLGR